METVLPKDVRDCIPPSLATNPSSTLSFQKGTLKKKKNLVLLQRRARLGHPLLLHRGRPLRLDLLIRLALPHPDLDRGIPALQHAGHLAVFAVAVVVGPAGLGRHQAPVVVGKGVRFLAVDGVVADQEGLLAHAQRDAQHVLDEEHDGAGPEDVPADHEERADDLDPDLAAVAGDRAAGVGEAEGGAAFHRGEEAGADAADKGADEVGVEDVEDVVDRLEEGEFATGDVETDPGNSAGSDAEDDGAPSGHDTGGWGDGDETGDHALDGSNDGRPTVVDEIAADPDKGADCGAEVGVENGNARVSACGVWITTVEAVPADPEDTGTDHHADNVIGCGFLEVFSTARSDPVCSDKRGSS